MKDATRLTSATLGRSPSRRSVNTPVERGSTVLFERADKLYDDDIKPTYGTDGLSTQVELCRMIAELEGAQESFILPSGLAALTLPIFACLQAGDEILAVNSCYAPVRRFLDTQLKRYGVTARYYDPALSADEVIALATPATKMIYVESPGSLTFDIQDIPAIARAAKARGVLTLCDNTYGGGLLFKPLAHGIDLSMQALTKYVGGHSDVLIGALSVSDAKLAKTLHNAIKAWGFFTSADESYLALRGLRTMTLRMQRSGESALKVARWLESRPEVRRVLHPGLPSDPGHAIWKRDFTGACGLFSIVLEPCHDKAVYAFMNELALFGMGFSWGGFESLCILFDCAEYRTATQWAPGGPTLRLHIGLEDPGDLIADLERGFAAMKAAS